MIVYEDLLTSLFCQPVYRYFHLTEPLRMVVVGFSLIVLADILPLWAPLKSSSLILRMKKDVAYIQPE